MSRHIDDLTQDCSNFIAKALELLQSGTKPWMCIATLEVPFCPYVGHMPLSDGPGQIKHTVGHMDFSRVFF